MLLTMQADIGCLCGREGPEAGTLCNRILTHPAQSCNNEEAVCPLASARQSLTGRGHFTRKVGTRGGVISSPSPTTDGTPSLQGNQVPESQAGGPISDRPIYLAGATLRRRRVGNFLVRDLNPHITPALGQRAGIEPACSMQRMLHCCSRLPSPPSQVMIHACRRPGKSHIPCIQLPKHQSTTSGNPSIPS